MSHASFAPDVKFDETKDLDEQTNSMLLRDKKTWSKGRVRRMKVISAIMGTATPSRKKVFSQIQEGTDYSLYNISVNETSIPCVKVFNPAILDNNTEIWNKLAHVYRFELEDPEGILTTIPKHFATKIKHLESFSITWTQVKSLPAELFHEGLKTLSLERNQLKNLDGIEKAVDLSNLNVSSNLLTELPKTFGHLKYLTNLNISGNAIKELPENFGSLNQLRLLDCSCNCLSGLPCSIENLLELVCLDVSNNHLTSLPDSIGNMSKLEDFRARANQLHSLPQSFWKLCKLRSLILRKNMFEEVSAQLSNIPNLNNLNMRENLIKSFSVSIPSLKTLILDSNELQEISNGILNCSNVEMLSLESNKITHIPENIKMMRSIRALHLSKNPIHIVSEAIGSLEHLRHISLSGTKITKLPNAIITMNNLVMINIDECVELEDKYLRSELKNKGIVGLKTYMQGKNYRGINSDVICNTQVSVIPDTGSFFQPLSETPELRSSTEDTILGLNRMTRMPSIWPSSTAATAVVPILESNRDTKMPQSWPQKNTEITLSNSKTNISQMLLDQPLAHGKVNLFSATDLKESMQPSHKEQQNSNHGIQIPVVHLTSGFPERTELINLSTFRESQTEYKDNSSITTEVSKLLRTDEVTLQCETVTKQTQCLGKDD